MNSALFILFAVAQARFGQEQIPIPAIAAVVGGEPGAAATIAGAAISDLLAGANACAKLQRGDQILEELGTGEDAIAAAIGMVAAEKNVNPFVATVPNICNDPTLPTNELLRGITPLVDPAFAGADVANALSAETAVTPLDATGKSVADLLIENGFTDFLGQGLDGATVAVGDAAGDAAVVEDDAGDAAATEVVDTAVAAVETATATVETAAALGTDACAALIAEALASASAVATLVDEAAVVAETAAADITATETAVAAEETAVAGADGAVAEDEEAVDAGADAEAEAGADAGAGGADFGVCDPTIKFEGGLGGRPATEFTFQSQDPNIEAVQQEALNPNIITNRICDELTNQCAANDAAITLCEDAQAQILALGTRDVTTAETWNELLGFAGTVTNPSGGPATPEEAGAVARMARRRRSFRA